MMTMQYARLEQFAARLDPYATKPADDPLVDNPFLNRTDQLPRPDADHPGFAYPSPENLRIEQAQWDDAERHRLWLKSEREQARDRFNQEIDEKIAKVHADVANDQQAEIEERLRTAYLTAPGTSDETWKADREQVLREHAKQAALAGGQDLIEMTKRQLAAARGITRF